MFGPDCLCVGESMIEFRGEQYYSDQDQYLGNHLDQRERRESVIPDFKDKIRYAPYVSFRSQISHIATNKE